MIRRFSQAIPFFLLVLLALLVLFAGCKRHEPKEREKADGVPQAEAPTEGTDTQTVYYGAIDACLLPDGGLLVLYARPPNAANFVDRLVRFDAEGNLDRELEIDLSFPHSINPTEKGTYLISDHGRNRMLEIDRDGAVLREMTDRQLGLDGFNFNSGIPTGRGSVLASGRDWGIIEFGWDKALMWKYQMFEGETPTFREKGAHDATVLENGNVLYVSTTTDEVIEIDRTGRTVKVIKNDSIRLPKNARRLKNGNTLIAHSGGLTELDPGGKRVRATNQWAACYNFKLLPDGNLLLAHTLAGVVIMDRDFHPIRTIRYRAPESWSVLQSSLSPERVESLRSLGYLK